MERNDNNGNNDNNKDNNDNSKDNSNNSNNKQSNKRDNGNSNSNQIEASVFDIGMAMYAMVNPNEMEIWHCHTNLEIWEMKTKMTMGITMKINANAFLM